MSTQNKPKQTKLISRISVRRLFGMYSYDIPKSGSPLFDSLMVLYGDNGSGKTTILKLIFAILYPKPTGGHKTFLAKTPFETFSIQFNDGSSITAKKISNLIGDYQIIVNDSLLSSEHHVPVIEDGTVQAQLEDLFARLRNFSPSLYFLADDRRVLSTKLTSDSGVRVRSSVVRAEDYAVTADGRVMARSDRPEPHHLDIRPALDTLANWVRRQAFQGSNLGEESTASVYLQVVTRLSRVRYTVDNLADSTFPHLEAKIRSLMKRTELFSRFGMSPAFAGERFIEVIRSTQPQTQEAVAGVLSTYLSGVEARLDALDIVRSLISTYTETINSFLHQKEITLSVQDGIGFKSKYGTIEAQWLSSGERQLVLLLTHAILARDMGGIFVIDEPEISLNIKWQRRLVEALLKCAEGSSIQYVLASHSLELISQYLTNSIQLRD